VPVGIIGGVDVFVVGFAVVGCGAGGLEEMVPADRLRRNMCDMPRPTL
jgi:hypothetical protein